MYQRRDQPFFGQLDAAGFKHHSHPRRVEPKRQPNDVAHRPAEIQIHPLAPLARIAPIDTDIEAIRGLILRMERYGNAEFSTA